MTGPTTHEFKAEIKQLLDIITHSLYTNKEIFLRELVSNASDALDKLRFETSSGVAAADPDLPLEIRITLDKDAKTLTIADTGVGMTEVELVEHIGTIAKSGSADFLKRVSEDKENPSNIIGRFGVGFYSVFMVASEVVIRSRSYLADQPPVEWRSDGLGRYDIRTLEGDEAAGVTRGTVIEVRLKDEDKDYAEKYRVESILKKHSSFIAFPVLLEGEQVNTIQALWREPKAGITPERYAEFYTFLTLDSDDPFETVHMSVDAPVQFNALLFVPGHSVDPMLLGSKKWGLDLYVRRVLIQRENQDLVPEYLSFLKGVVDTEDLPLNVSRETLQENAVIRRMSSAIVKNVLARLQKLADDEPARYVEFWKAHGKVLKFGYSDYLNRDKIGPLLRFNSSALAEAGDLTSLDEYIGRAKDGQKAIYFLSGPSREAVALNPHLEILKSKGLEVLYLFEPVDEFAMDSLGKYKEFDLVSAESVDPATLEQFASVAEAKEPVQELSKDDEGSLSAFLARAKAILGDKVTEVRESKRLKDSPAVLTAPDGAMSSQMQKIMQMVSKDTSVPQKVMEINRDHKLVRNLLKVFKANPDDEFITTAVLQLYESSLLLDGYLSDPHAMVSRMNELLERSSGWYAEVKKL
jgi:molecular chaperone HtpG